MDFTESRYYRITRIWLMCFGLWPYYSKRAKYIHCVFLSPFVFSGLINQLSSFITKEYSADLLLNIYSFTGTTMYYIIRYLHCFINKDELKKLMEQMQCNWNSLQDEKELKIIYKYNNITKYIIIIITCLHTILIIFMLGFFWPNILNIVMPLNESRQAQHFPSELEYFIDQDKYFYLIAFHAFTNFFVAINILISIEMLILLFSQHICAMLQITSYRIEYFVERNVTKSSGFSKRSNSSSDKSITEVIDCHRKVLEFGNDLKFIHNKVFIFAIPLSVGSISVNLYRLCKYIMMRDISIMSILSFWYIVFHLSYLFYSNYINQRMLDHNENVYKKLCSTRWYATPVHVQKYILLIMCRSMKTSKFMIAGIFAPSLEGYTTLVSMALSYFTVIYSTYERRT